MTSRHITKLLLTVYCFFLGIAFSVAQQHESQQPEDHHQGDATAQHGETAPKAAFDPASVMMEHIMDAHEFHFISIGDRHISIPLPVILYSPQRGLSVFSYGKFHHGHNTYEGYKTEHGHIVPVREDGSVDTSVQVYDFSLTRNVVQMIIALTVLVLLLTGIAKKYKKNGPYAAPSGWQNAVEPLITFIRDEVGKPNLGKKYIRYMPYLLTIFFFILINNLFGLIPGSANVTGNIAFTMVLAVISLLVILFSTNSHFWAHIFWPPGMPVPVKLILIPVELAGILIRPAALMIRLFANMVAGHIVITCFVLLIFIFGAMNKAAGIGFAPVSLAFTIFIYLIEIMIAFIQAYIFTNLTAVFISQAFEGGHDDVDGHTDPVIV